MKITSKKVLKEKLKSVSGIEKRVLRDALDYSTNISDVINYLKDVTQHGCAGCCYGLVYYKDTTKFYDTYADEIEDLLYEYQQNMGFANRFAAIASFRGAENVGDITQEKNLLAWFAYEEIARKILQKYFGIE